MYKICLIDDEYYWIAQVIYSIPKNTFYKFYYYNRITDIEDINFDIVLLDFYLDKDNKIALDIIKRFLWAIIIWFSSLDEKNNLIIEKWWLYKAEKLKDTNENKGLEILLKSIFNRFLPSQEWQKN